MLVSPRAHTLFVFNFHFTAYSSESGSGDGCEETVALNDVNNSIIYVPSGTICFDCYHEEHMLVGFPFEFMISESVSNSSSTISKRLGEQDTIYRLVVPDSTKTFSTSSAEFLMCCEQPFGNVRINKTLYRAGVLLYHGKLL